MKKIFTFFIIAIILATAAFSQIKFSDETKKYIEYNDSITVFKNALLVDGKDIQSKRLHHPLPVEKTFMKSGGNRNLKTPGESQRLN